MRGLGLSPVKEFRSLTGQGVQGEVDGHRVAVGNLKLLEALGVDAAPLTGHAERLRADGQTAMYVAIDGRAAGLVGVADAIKASTPEAVAALHGQGLKVVMLTGITGARTWCGHGVFAHNLVKISALAA